MPRQERLMELARREVQPQHTAEFAPITRGPLVAWLGLAAIGVAAGVYVVFRKLGAFLTGQRRS